MEEIHRIKNSGKILSEEEISIHLLDIARTMIKNKSLGLDVELQLGKLKFNISVDITESKDD